MIKPLSVLETTRHDAPALHKKIRANSEKSETETWADVKDSNTSLVTRTGFNFEVRHARIDDEPTLAEFFTHVTPQDLRFRFLGGMKAVSHERLLAMTRSDDSGIHNFLAFSIERVLIAIATLASDAAGRDGEVAICIRDDHKHLGVSWEFLDYIANYAEGLGLDAIESIETRDNHAAIDLERDMGFTVTSYPDDPTLVLVKRRLGSSNAREQRP